MTFRQDFVDIWFSAVQDKQGDLFAEKLNLKKIIIQNVKHLTKLGKVWWHSSESFKDIYTYIFMFNYFSPKLEHEFCWPSPATDAS